MAWNNDRVFVTGANLTAAQMNQITANLNETAPAKAVASGDLFVANGTNSIQRLPIGTNGHLLQSSNNNVAWSGTIFPSGQANSIMWLNNDREISFTPIGDPGSVMYISANRTPSFGTGNPDTDGLMYHNSSTGQLDWLTGGHGELVYFDQDAPVALLPGNPGDLLSLAANDRPYWVGHTFNGSTINSHNQFQWQFSSWSGALSSHTDITLSTGGGIATQTVGLDEYVNETRVNVAFLRLATTKIVMLQFDSDVTQHPVNTVTGSVESVPDNQDAIPYGVNALLTIDHDFLNGIPDATLYSDNNISGLVLWPTNRRISGNNPGFYVPAYGFYGVDEEESDQAGTTIYTWHNNMNGYVVHTTWIQSGGINIGRRAPRPESPYDDAGFSIRSSNNRIYVVMKYDTRTQSGRTRYRYYPVLRGTVFIYWQA